MIPEEFFAMNEIKVRPYRSEDITRLQDIAQEAWREIFLGYREQIGDDLFEQSRPDPECKRKEVLYRAQNTPDCIVVAEDADGKILGFATYNLDFEHKIGEISSNAVDKTLGVKGVGQAMYAELFRRFKAAGMTAAKVTTGLDDGHAPARRAYQRAGFGELSLSSITYFKKL